MIEPDPAVALAQPPGAEDASAWRKLALTLYDGRYDQDTLEALAWMERNDPDARFLTLVWQGHIRSASTI